MNKKILLGLGVAGVAVATLPLFAAFEAHVINVTARIENALFVPLEHLDFGTVFPQEYLLKDLDVSLSQSFLDEDRVDDVEYFIRQKPKCGVTTLDGQELVQGSTATGHLSPDGQGGYTIDCGEAPIQYDSQTHKYDVLPLLCPYLSKHPDGVDDAGEELENDGWLPSFHVPFSASTSTISWNDVLGRLAKSDNDTVDNWVIDLSVPCFGDHCAQDWADFVASKNPDADPEQWIQDLDNEHKVFGCDLWVEVYGISLPPGLGCNEAVDVMLVLDRSGSVGGDMATLKTAAKAFVDALTPTASGPHIGMVSFSDSASLDSHLTDDGAAVKAAIDALSAGGITNLADGISTADTELDNPGDGHDRSDGTSPDFIVVITDGAPNAGGGEAGAKAAADAAKADGATIFVVGVGTSVSTSEFLQDDIATPPPADHYFDAADFGDLEDTLEDLVSCPVI